MKDHNTNHSISNTKYLNRLSIKKAAILLSATLLVLNVFHTALAEGAVPVTGVSLDKSNAGLVSGTSLSLTAFVEPEDASDRNVFWSSNNSAVASVENGIVKGLSPGSAIITVKTEVGGFSCNCAVDVIEPLSGISIYPSYIDLCPGDTAELKATTSGSGIVWSSGSSEIVSVDNGKITANCIGEAKVTAESGDGNDTVSCSVNVVSPQISSSAYTIDRDNGFITGIPDFTSSAVFLKNFGNGINDLSLKKADGNVYGGIAVGTGMALNLNVNGRTRDSLKLVVPGDIDGDGAVTISDYTLARLYILGSKTFAGPYLKACDLDGDGNVTIADYTLIGLDITGIKPINGDTPPLPSVSDPRISAFLGTALAQRGKPYVWGDEGPDSFDCSGFVYYCLSQTGYTLDRDTADMYSKNTCWKYVDKDKLEPGDLMFFNSDSKPGVIGHIGIYLGNGYLIHASSDYGCIIICPLDGWYSKMLSFGRRVFN